MQTMWVICWHYSDRSAYGVLAAFDSKEGAERMLAMLNSAPNAVEHLILAVPYMKTGT